MPLSPVALRSSKKELRRRNERFPKPVSSLSTFHGQCVILLSRTTFAFEDIEHGISFSGFARHRRKLLKPSTQKSALPGPEKQPQSNAKKKTILRKHIHEEAKEAPIHQEAKATKRKSSNTFHSEPPKKAKIPGNQYP